MQDLAVFLINLDDGYNPLGLVAGIGSAQR
jgi:hypothetical protein